MSSTSIDSSTVSSTQASLTDVQPGMRFIIEGNTTKLVQHRVQKDGKTDTKTTVLGDFVLRVAGTVTGSSNHFVFECRGLRCADGSAEQRTVIRNIILTADSFNHRNTFAKDLRAAFGGNFCIKGTLSADTLSYYYLHLKTTYLRNGPFRSVNMVEYTGYMGDDYWVLNEEVHISGRRILGHDEQRYFLVVAEEGETHLPREKRARATLDLNKSLLQSQNVCLQINRRFADSTALFTVNCESLRMATAFALGRILRTSFASRSRQKNGKSNVVLLHGEEMNVGKTVSQEILNYGQGANKREHLLFVTGGCPHSVGTTL
eukprot:Seg6610.1 transcript_id=Seg6610.1/GoldUCD/mRNA.D3Y31 product="hypothetical protein" protein_id=Seg6610.1/GoldUCD/D3Y31